MGYRRILSPSERRSEGDDPAFHAALTLPVTRRSRYIGICSYQPAVFCRPLPDQICSKPRRRAIVTACVRSLAWSLSTRFLMWKLTVFSEIAS